MHHATEKLFVELRIGFRVVLFLAAVLALNIEAKGNDQAQVITLSNYPIGWTPDSPMMVGRFFPGSLGPDGQVIFTGAQGKIVLPPNANVGGIWSYNHGTFSPIVSPGTLAPPEDPSGQFYFFDGVGAAAGPDKYFVAYSGISPVGPDDVLMISHSGDIKTVFVNNQVVPSTNEIWSSLYIGVSAGGRLLTEAFTFSDDNPTHSRLSLWSVDSDAVPHMLTFAGGTLDGLAPGQTVNYFSSYMVNDHGTMAFVAGYHDATETQFGQGIWRQTDDTGFHPILKTNDLVDFKGQQVALSVGSFGLNLNNSDELAFHGSITVPSQSPYAFDTLWLQEPDGGRHLLAYSGETVHTGNSDTVIGRFDSEHLNPTTYLNDHGQVAFVADFTRPSQLPTAPIQEIRAPGISALDVGPVLPAFGEGIYVEDHGDLKLAVQSGDVLPGDDRPLVLAEPWGLNNANQLLVWGTLVDPITGPPGVAAEYGLWIRNPDGGFHFLIKTGDKIDVSPGAPVDLRTVAIFQPLDYSTVAGDPTFFNDAGQVLLQLTFTDDLVGIFLISAANVPEPEVGVLVTLAGVLLLPRRWSRSGHSPIQRAEQGYILALE